MKKSVLAAAALTAFVGAASAQSSVTLFGILDVAARNVNNASGGSLKTLSTNGQATSRLGFRGVEDLGGGMSAGFWLEGEINPDVGGGGKTAANANGSTPDPMTWTRRATVSLTGGFGEIRLGRDYTATFNNLAAYDMFGYVGVSSIANIRSVLGTVNTTTGAVTGSGAGTAVRANNTISYFLPSMGGLYGQIEVAAGEGATGNKYGGARLGYAAGPLNISAAYGKTYKTGTMVDDLKVINAGFSYNLGFLTVQGSVEKSDYSTSQQKLISGGVLIPLGTGNVKLNYTQAKGSFDSFGAKLLAAGYVYDLSKRTSLYAGYGRIQNAGNTTVGGTFTASSGGPAGIKKGETSSGYDLGIRHNF
jgi:predicted porin